MIIMIVLIGHVKAVDSKCSDFIPGCHNCNAIEAAASSTDQSSKWSCTECQTPYFLLKIKNPSTSIVQNICVENCRQYGQHLTSDFENRQCVNLGNYCMNFGEMVFSNGTKSKEMECNYSEMKEKGFILEERERIVSQMKNVLGETSFLVQELEPPVAASLQESEKKKVMGKCLNERCLACESFDLTKCSSCRGRFGDKNKFNSCFRPATCNAISYHTDFKTGCFKTKVTCDGCQICDLGYAMQPNGACTNCQGVDLNCEHCSYDATNGRTNCDSCKSGLGLDSLTKTCKACQSPNTHSCSHLGHQEIIQSCANGFYLSSDAKSCQLTCKKDEFVGEPLLNSEDRLSKIQCKKCHASCNTCINKETAASCTSCKYGMFLTISHATLRSGSCAPKKSSAGVQKQQIKVFTAKDYDLTTMASSAQYQPDLLSAIFEVFTHGSAYQTGLSFEILIQPGQHWIKKSHIAEFERKKLLFSDVDFDSAEFELVMKADPRLCLSLSTLDEITSCQAAPTVISNKVGALFQMQVPRSLTVQDLVFDGLQSVQTLGSPFIDTDANECSYNSTVDPLPVCTGLSPGYLLNFNQKLVCQTRSLHSLFKMKIVNIERAYTTATPVQKLVIKNVEFTNIFYEMGSLIRVPDTQSGSPWSVEISESTFSNLSFCGSIFSNDMPVFVGEASSSVFSLVGQNLKEQISEDYQAPQEGMKVSTIDCSTTACFTFIFRDNQVKNLNALKTGPQKLFEATVAKEMHLFGLAVHLKGFQGDIVIQNNTFSTTAIRYTDSCTIHKQDQSCFRAEPNTAWRDALKFEAKVQDTTFNRLVGQERRSYQLHSMLVIDRHPDDKVLQINNNTFQSVSLTGSLLRISLESVQGAHTKQVTLHANKFTGVSSSIGANVATITKQTDLDTCKQAVTISQNSFEDIYGSCQVQTGLIKVQCNSTALLDTSGQKHFVSDTLASARSNPISTQTGYDKAVIDAKISAVSVELAKADPDFEAINHQMQPQSFIIFANNSVLTSQVGRAGALVDFQNIEMLLLLGNEIKALKLPKIDQQFLKAGLPFWDPAAWIQEEMSKMQWSIPAQSSCQVEEQETSKSLVFVESSAWLRIDGFKLLDVEADFFSRAVVFSTDVQPQVAQLRDQQVKGLFKLRTPLYQFVVLVFDSMLNTYQPVNPAKMTLLSLTSSSYSNIQFDDSSTLKTSALLFQQQGVILGQLTLQDVSVSEVGVPDQTFSMLSALKVEAINATLTSFKISKLSFRSNAALVWLKCSSIEIKQSTFSDTQIVTGILEIEAIDSVKLVKIQILGSISHESLIKVSMVLGQVQILDTQLKGNQVRAKEEVQPEHCCSLFSLSQSSGTFELRDSQIEHLLTALDALIEYFSPKQPVSGYVQMTLAGNTLKYQRAKYGLVKTQFQYDLLRLEANQITRSSQSESVQTFDWAEKRGPRQIEILNQVFEGEQNEAVTLEQLLASKDDERGAEILSILNYQKVTNIVNIHNVTFQNFQLRSKGLITLQNTNINVSAAIIRNISSVTGGFVHVVQLPGPDQPQLKINLAEITMENVVTGSGALIKVEGRDQASLAASSVIAESSTVILLQISMKNCSSNFVWATQNGVQDIKAYNAHIKMDDMKVNNSQTTQNNSVARIVLSGKQSSVEISKCIFELGTAHGQATIELNAPKLSIVDSEFKENRASSVTHGILFSSKDTYDLEIKGSKFSSVKHLSQSTEINGAYLHFPKSSSTRTVSIVNSLFRMGSANRGGAIYSSGQIRLTILGSQFYFNRAHEYGGAIYVDKISYKNDSNVIIDKFEDQRNYFVSNLALAGGDALFASEETQAQAYGIRRLTGSATIQSSQKIKVFNSDFNTPGASGQLYFLQVSSLELEGLLFLPMLNTNAIQGGSVYCLDCMTVKVSDSQFQEQRAIISGGSLFFRFRDTNQSQQASIKMSGLSFSGSSSHQGGAIYLQNYRSVSLTSCNFTSNFVYLKTHEGYRTFVKSVVRSDSLRLPAEFIDDQDVVYEGYGPDLFSNCEHQDCSIVLQGVLSHKSFVRDVQKNEMKEVKVDEAPIFYKQVRPLIETGMPASNLMPTQMETLNINSYDIMIVTQTQLNKTMEEKAQLMNGRLNLTGAEFKDYAGFKDFKVGRSLLPKSAVFVTVNDLQEAQFSDSLSFVELQLNETQVYETSEIKAGFIVESKDSENKRFRNYRNRGKDSEVLFNKIIVQANMGIIDLEGIEVFAPPGSLLELRVNFTSPLTGKTVTHVLTIQTQSCVQGQAVASSGECKDCHDSHSYSLVEPNKIQRSPFNCSACNNTVFTCNEGHQISAKPGFFMIQGQKNKVTDNFSKCDKVEGLNPCLAENKCSPGYEGLLCKQCAPGYFKDYLGLCLECGPQLATILKIAVSWILLLLVTLIVANGMYAYQKDSSVSFLLGLARNLINYVVSLALISQIFEETWNVSRISLETGFTPPISSQVLKQFFQSMYELPISAVNMQCLVKNTGEQVAPQKVQTFTLALGMLFLSVFCFLQALCSKKEEEKLPNEIFLKQLKENLANKSDTRVPPPMDYSLNLAHNLRETSQRSVNRNYRMPEIISVPVDDQISETSKENSIYNSVNSARRMANPDVRPQRSNQESINLEGGDRSEFQISEQRDPSQLRGLAKTQSPRESRRIQPSKTSNRQGRHATTFEQDSAQNSSRTDAFVNWQNKIFSSQRDEREGDSPQSRQQNLRVNMKILKDTNSHLNHQNLTARSQPRSMTSVTQKSEATLVLDKKLQAMKLRRSTIFLIVCSSLLNLQIFQQLLIMTKCKKIENIITNKNLFPSQINFYDSGTDCEDQTLLQVIGISYMCLWLMVAPCALLIRSRLTYFLDIVSFNSKFVIIVLNVLSVSALQTSIVVMMLILVQLVLLQSDISLSYIPLSSEKAKQKKILLVDIIMQLTLLLTVALSLTFEMVDSTKKSKQMMLMSIPVIQAIYIVFWVVMLVRLGRRELIHSKTGLYVCLSWPCLGKKGEDKLKAKIQRRKIEDIKQKQIDVMISYLTDINKEQLTSPGAQIDLLPQLIEIYNDMNQEVRDAIQEVDSEELQDVVNPLEHKTAGRDREEYATPYFSHRRVHQDPDHIGDDIEPEDALEDLSSSRQLEPQGFNLNNTQSSIIAADHHASSQNPSISNVSDLFAPSTKKFKAPGKVIFSRKHPRSGDNISERKRHTRHYLATMQHHNPIEEENSSSKEKQSDIQVKRDSEESISSLKHLKASRQLDRGGRHAANQLQNDGDDLPQTEEDCDASMPEVHSDRQSKLSDLSLRLGGSELARQEDQLRQNASLCHFPANQLFHQAAAFEHVKEEAVPPEAPLARQKTKPPPRLLSNPSAPSLGLSSSNNKPYGSFAVESQTFQHQSQANLEAEEQAKVNNNLKVQNFIGASHEVMSETASHNIHERTLRQEDSQANIIVQRVKEGVGKPPLKGLLVRNQQKDRALKVIQKLNDEPIHKD